MRCPCEHAVSVVTEVDRNFLIEAAFSVPSAINPWHQHVIMCSSSYWNDCSLFLSFRTLPFHSSKDTSYPTTRLPFSHLKILERVPMCGGGGFPRTTRQFSSTDSTHFWCHLPGDSFRSHRVRGQSHSLPDFKHQSQVPVVTSASDQLAIDGRFRLPLLGGSQNSEK